jgi:hypothetical protein
MTRLKDERITESVRQAWYHTIEYLKKYHQRAETLQDSFDQTPADEARKAIKAVTPPIPPKS